jgi:hypothetical protein
MSGMRHVGDTGVADDYSSALSVLYESAGRTGSSSRGGVETSSRPRPRRESPLQLAELHSQSNF